jgi:hypothetical protein
MAYSAMPVSMTTPHAIIRRGRCTTSGSKSMAEPSTGTSELRATPVIESFCEMIYKRLLKKYR